jgi:hypothetical protein
MERITRRACAMGSIHPRREDDVQLAVKLNSEGRIGLVNGDAQEFLSGITANSGKHTYASQFIAVNTAPGVAVLASDNRFLYET